MSKPPKPTTESRAFAEALERCGKSQEQVAEEVGIKTVSYISQFKNGRRPIPAIHAEALAESVGSKPELISRAFADLLRVKSAAVVGGEPMFDNAVDVRRPDLAQRRNENDILSMRYAIGAIATAMRVNRPREAKEVAAALRKKVKKKFLDRGFLPEFLDILEAPDE